MIVSRKMNSTVKSTASNRERNRRRATIPNTIARSATTKVFVSLANIGRDTGKFSRKREMDIRSIATDNGAKSTEDVGNELRSLRERLADVSYDVLQYANIAPGERLWRALDHIDSAIDKLDEFAENLTPIERVEFLAKLKRGFK